MIVTRYSMTVVLAVLALLAVSVCSGPSTSALTRSNATRNDEGTSRCTHLLWKEMEKELKRSRTTSRCRRSKPRSGIVLVNTPPKIQLNASTDRVMLPCSSSTADCKPSSQLVTLKTNATDDEADTLLFTYSVTGGRVTGDGPDVQWDLRGLQAGSYTGTVEVDDGCGCLTFTSVQVVAENCSGC